MTLQEVIQKAAATRSCDQSDYIHRMCTLIRDIEMSEALDFYKESFRVPKGFSAAKLLLITDEYMYIRRIEYHRPEIIMEVFDFGTTSIMT